MKSILGATWHRTPTLPNHKKTRSPKFLRKLRLEYQRSGPMSSEGRKPNFSALSRLDGFPLNPRIQGHCGTAPKTSRDAHSTNEGAKEYDAQSDPHPEASISQSQTRRNSGLEETHDTSMLDFLTERNFLRLQACAQFLSVSVGNLSETWFFLYELCPSCKLGNIYNQSICRSIASVFCQTLRQVAEIIFVGGKNFRFFLPALFFRRQIFDFRHAARKYGTLRPQNCLFV